MMSLQKVVPSQESFPAHEQTTESCFVKLYGSSSGASGTEYAIMLAIIVGGVMVAINLLGGSLSRSFDRIADMSSPNHAESAVSNSSDSHPARVEAESPQVARNHRNLLLLLTQGIAIASLGLLLVLLRKYRKLREAKGMGDELPKRVLGTYAQNRLYKKRQQIYHMLTNDMAAVLASRMDVQHVMSASLKIVQPSTSVSELESLMGKGMIHHLLVCDTNERLLGIISDRDLNSKAGSCARDIMTRNPITVTPKTQIVPAVTVMIERRISCLPVLEEDGKLVGLLTSTDLMLALQCAMQILQRMALELDLHEKIEEDGNAFAHTADETGTAREAVSSLLTTLPDIPVCQTQVEI